jgi:hypothetical protein
MIWDKSGGLVSEVERGSVSRSGPIDQNAPELFLPVPAARLLRVADPRSGVCQK